ncbi:MAG: phosphatase PAP2 family protein [Pseudomonadota bacterium]|nr:phosphatase PAP2 family protein [Pseudomonadota bacterium]
MSPAGSSAWVWLPPVLSLSLLATLAAGAANRSLFVLLNQFGHPLGDELWLNLTMLGDGAVALAMVLPAIRRSPRCFWAALVAAVVAALWVHALKQVVSMPRPLAVLPADVFFQSGPAFRAGSFPSGHAAASFAIAGIWIMALPGRNVARALLLALAALVCLSRLMVGVHWPVDILWGMLGGWLGAWTGHALYTRYQWKNGRRRRRPGRWRAAAGRRGAAGQPSCAKSRSAAAAAHPGRDLPGLGRARNVPDAAAHAPGEWRARWTMTPGGCWSASADRACSCCAW